MLHAPRHNAVLVTCLVLSLMSRVMLCEVSPPRLFSWRCTGGMNLDHELLACFCVNTVRSHVSNGTLNGLGWGGKMRIVTWRKQRERGSR